MEKLFRYDTNRFKKRLLLRFGVVLSLYTVFLIWNFLQIPEDGKKEFLSLFLPMSGLLGFFLYRSFRRQILLLSDTTLILQGSTLLQYDKEVESAEYNLSNLIKIYSDEFKSYPRVILEWEDSAISFVNLEYSDRFLEELIQITKLNPEVTPPTKKLLSWMSFLYLSPSVIYLLLVSYFESSNIAYLNWKTFLLFTNVNLILVLLYSGDKKKAKWESVYQSRRKIIFILLVVFFYQIFLQFSSSLGIF